MGNFAHKFHVKKAKSLSMKWKNMKSESNCRKKKKRKKFFLRIIRRKKGKVWRVLRESQLTETARLLKDCLRETTERHDIDNFKSMTLLQVETETIDWKLFVARKEMLYNQDYQAELGKFNNKHVESWRNLWNSQKLFIRHDLLKNKKLKMFLASCQPWLFFNFFQQDVKLEILKILN